MPQQLTDSALQVSTVRDGIQHSVIEQKFRSLKPVGEILPERLLDDAWTREADDGPRLR